MTAKVILVTGASGRVAQAVAPWLAARDDLTVRWQSRVSTSALPGWVRCDPLHEIGRLRDLCAGCDAVVHLAGVTSTAQTPAYVLNSRLGLVVLQAAHQVGVPRVFAASSAAVYGAGDRAFTEDAILAPITPYGRSKQRMERHLTTAALGIRSKLCLLRIGNVAGADALLSGQPRPTVLDQYEDGTTPIRSYISPETLARVFIELVQMDGGELPLALNVGAAQPVEMAQLLQAAGLPWEPNRVVGRQGQRAVLCTDRLRTLVRIDQTESSPRFLTRHLVAKPRQAAMQCP